MTGRGRPTTGVKVQVRIPADLLAALDAYATAHATTRAWAIRHFLLCGMLDPKWQEDGR